MGRAGGHVERHVTAPTIVPQGGTSCRMRLRGWVEGAVGRGVGDGMGQDMCAGWPGGLPHGHVTIWCCSSACIVAAVERKVRGSGVGAP